MSLFDSVEDIKALLSTGKIISSEVVPYQPSILKGGDVLMVFIDTDNNPHYAIVNYNDNVINEPVSVKNKDRRVISDLLLHTPKSNQPRTTFKYYGKDIIVPNIGDIIIVNYSNFDMYYYLVWDVTLGSGKTGTVYKVVLLEQKGMSRGSYAPFQIVSRSDLELTGSYYLVNPKDRSKIISLTVLDI